MKSVHHGLDGAVRTQRRTLFGPNVMDVEGKSTVSLLIDEVRVELCLPRYLANQTADHTPLLCFPNCKHYPVVAR